MLKLSFLPLGRLSQASGGKAPLSATPSAAAAAQKASLVKEKGEAGEGSKKRAEESCEQGSSGFSAWALC